MKYSRVLIFSLAALLLFGGATLRPTPAQQQQQQKAAVTASGAGASAVDADRIIRALTTKETEFRKALNNYAFKREAVVQTIGQGGQITGEYRRDSFFTFDDAGNRYEKVSFAPISTLSELTITPTDLEDMNNLQQFALETSRINLYDLAYAGRERIDELDLYVFDVTPKVIPDPKKSKERFFKGRIWVDDRDLQIVKVRGKTVPETKNDRKPTFETYREQIDGRYWFPTYTYVDEEMDFDGRIIHIRMRLRFTDYERARGTVNIKEIDEAPDAEPTPKPTPSPKKP